MSAGECDDEEFYDAEDFLTTEEEEEEAASSSSGREADSSPTPRFATQPAATTTAAVAAASSGGEDAERTESPGKLFSRSAPALPQRLCLITDLDSGRTYPLPAVDAATGTLPVVSAPRVEVHHLQSVSTATSATPQQQQQQPQSRVAGFFGRLTQRRKGAAALGFAQSRVVQQLQQTAADAEGGDGPRRSGGHPVWVLQWSRCRTMLAAAGHDHAVTVWRRSSGPDAGSVFDPAPCAVLRGHADDVFAVDWVAAPSQKDAASPAAAALPRVVSGGMDRTARVWELSVSASSGGRLLATFAHPDVVTSVACDPENSDNVLTGSLDNIVRLWSVRDPKQPSKYINIGEFVTAVAFVGSALAVIGTTDGNCIFLNTHDFTIERRLTLLSFHGRRSREGRRKVTGFSVRPHAGEAAAAADTQLLVTSSDSRARLYSLRDLRLIGKFKGFASTNLCQIHASFSDGGAFAICGSEAKCACFWRALSNPSGTQQQQQQAPPRASVPAELFSTSRRDVTATAFVPRIHDSEFPEGSLFVAADIAGAISVFENPVLSHC